MSTENKKCANCQKNFEITPADLEFYKKIEVPSPTWCPACRFQRRLLWRNERKFFHNTSARSGKKIFSLVSPDSGMTIYDEDEWWSDDWDSMDYAQDYDFSKPFFEQFKKLIYAVPYYSRNCAAMVNSEYSGNASYLKNCYLLFNSNESEDSAYGNAIDRSKFCIDNSHVTKGEYCYASLWLTNCNRAHFSVECEESLNLWFCKDCRGCSDCVGCVGLRNKKYCIFNKPYSKEEYEKKIKGLELDSWSGLQKVKEKAQALWLTFPNKYNKGTKNVNSIGFYINNSKNVQNGYLVRGAEDCKYIDYMQIPTSNECYDCSVFGFGQNNELNYECSVCGLGTYNIKFCFDCWPDDRDLEYCMSCKSSSDCFGCVGLRNKKYCILNKQYSKEEYFELVEKIKKQMDEMPYIDKAERVYKYGEFFPAELSPWAYNETIAPEHFPSTKEEIEKQGCSWRARPETEYEINKDLDDIPNAIKNADDSILQDVFGCAECGHAYRLIKQEFDFLKDQKIPIPRTCFECRHQERISKRLKNRLYHRTCMNDGCDTEFKTAYAPDQPEIVYCEKCYQREVI